MTTRVNNSIARILICLILALALVFTVALTGCDSGKKDVDPTTTVSPTAEPANERLVYKNGDFETVGEKPSYPVTSVTSFGQTFDYLVSSSEKATSTSATGYSGVIDTSLKNDNVKNDSGEETEDLTNGALYKATGLSNAENPGACPTAKEKDFGTHILMIRNKVATAQRYYTSSSFSLAAGTYAKISVWVYTHGLKDLSGNASDAIGANVSISNSTTMIASTSETANDYDAVSIRNIQTDDTWKQIVIYVAGSDLSAKTIYVTLGLGKGSDTVQTEYAEGYAFFDELLVEYVSRKDFEEQTEDLTTVFATRTGSPVVIAQNDPFIPAASPLAVLFDENNVTPITSLLTDFLPTASDVSVAPTDAEGVKGVLDLDAAKAVDAKAFENFPFSSNEDIVMIQNKIPTSYSVRTNFPLPISPNTYYALSMYVKTSAIVGTTGAGISLITTGDLGKEYEIFNSFTNINTSTADHSEEKNYFWDGWTQYVFFIKNTTNAPISVSLRLSLGALDVSNLENISGSLDLTQGWAAFTGFNVQEISRLQYNATHSGNYKSVDLYYGNYANPSNAGFDAKNENDSMENAPAAPKNWTSASAEDAKIGGNNATDKEKTVSGLVNSAYWANYGLGLGVESWHGSDALVGDNPLLIYNGTEKAFGYLSAKKTLSTSTYYEISVLVKAIGDAKAYFYLSDIDLTKSGAEAYAVRKLNVPASGKDKQYPAYTKDFVISVAGTDGKNTKDNSPIGYSMGDGWIKLAFYVKVGDTAINYRAEVWNGARDGKDNSTGYVFFQNFSEKSITEAEYNTALDKYIEYYDLSEKKDGEVVYKAGVTQYLREKLESDLNDPTVKIVAVDTEYAQFVNYTELDIVETEQQEEEEEKKPSSCSTNIDTSILLWLSTLLLALALIVVLIVLIVRGVKKRVEKNTKVKLSGHYDPNAQQSQVKRTEQLKAKQAAKEEAARKAAEEEAARKAAEEEAARKAEEEAARKAEEEAKAAEEAARKAEEEAKAAEEAARKAEEEAKAAEEAKAEEAAPETPAEPADAPAEEPATEEAPADAPAETPAEEPAPETPAEEPTDKQE